MTLTLNQGHLCWDALNDLSTEHNLANFYDCRDDNIQENAKVTEFPILSMGSPRLSIEYVTLNEGHL